MPSETESCSNPLVWPITRMCLRWTCFSCGGGGSEGSPAGSFWAAIKAARTGSKKKSNGAIRAGRKRSPSKHSFRDTVWHDGTLIGVLRCRRTLKVTQGTPRGLAQSLPLLGAFSGYCAISLREGPDNLHDCFKRFENPTLSKKATRSYYPVHAFAAATRIGVASVSGSGCRWAMSELRGQDAPE